MMRRAVSILCVALAACLPISAWLWSRSFKRGTPPLNPGRGIARLAFNAPVHNVPFYQQQLVDMPDPPGTLRLQGQVIDENEHGIGKALVSIDSTPPQRAITEDDGSFSFNRLLEGVYHLEAVKDNRAGGPVSWLADAHSEPLILQLIDGVRLEVSVLDQLSQTAVTDARITLFSIEPRVAKTDHQGHARLNGITPGRYWLEASAEGFEPASRLMIIGRGRRKQEELFYLQRGMAVQGRVTRRDGKPLASAVVTARSVAMSREVSSTASDIHGHWHLNGLAPGTYRFIALHEDMSPALSAPILIDEQHLPDPVIMIMDQGGTARGRVLFKNKRPAAGALVRVAAAPWQSMTRKAQQVRCDHHGYFRLTNLPHQQLYLAARHERATSLTKRLDLSHRSELRIDIVLDQDQKISGLVVDDQGHHVSHAQINARPAKTSWSDHWQLRSLREGFLESIADGAGHFVLHGLSDGTYLLNAWSFENAAFNQNRSPPPMKTASGATNVHLLLPARGSIKGRLQHANGTVPRIFVVQAGGVESFFSESNGSFLLADVPTGPLVIRISGPDFMMQREHSAIVTPYDAFDLGTITVQEGKAIRGHVKDRRGFSIGGVEVIAGSVMSGDGRRLQHMSYMDQFFGIRRTMTDANGAFQIEHLSEKHSLTVIADHPTAGRSSTVEIPAEPQDHPLELVLEPVSSLYGQITRNGAPVSAKVHLQRLNTDSNAAKDSVSYTSYSDADGTYAFDRIPHGTYRLAASMFNDVGATGLATTASVSVGRERVLANVELAEGVTLIVQLSAAAVREIFFVGIIDQEIPSTTMHSFFQQAAKLGPSQTARVPVQELSEVAFHDLHPATYSLCPLGFRQNKCRRIVITPTPDEQIVQLDIPNPAVHEKTQEKGSRR